MASLGKHRNWPWPKLAMFCKTGQPFLETGHQTGHVFRKLVMVCQNWPTLHGQKTGQLFWSAKTGQPWPWPLLFQKRPWPKLAIPNMASFGMASFGMASFGAWETRPAISIHSGWFPAGMFFAPRFCVSVVRRLAGASRWVARVVCCCRSPL